VKAALGDVLYGEALTSASLSHQRCLPCLCRWVRSRQQQEPSRCGGGLCLAPGICPSPAELLSPHLGPAALLGACAGHAGVVMGTGMLGGCGIPRQRGPWWWWWALGCWGDAVSPGRGDLGEAVL